MRYRLDSLSTSNKENNAPHDAAPANDHEILQERRHSLTTSNRLFYSQKPAFGPYANPTNAWDQSRVADIYVCFVKSVASRGAGVAAMRPHPRIAARH
jgi:hypothetical protein